MRMIENKKNHFPKGKNGIFVNNLNFGVNRENKSSKKRSYLHLT